MLPVGYGSIMETALARATPSTREEQERQLVDLQQASEAGELDQVGVAAVEYLLSRLPEGYALDEDNRVVRLDPSLPDHFYVPALIFGVAADPVRIPVYR